MRVIAIAGILWAAAFAAASGQSRSLFPGTLDQHPAIDYRTSALTDPITALQRDLTAGSASLEFEGRLGFLRSLLAALNVPVESQILLFSKTGIQHPFTNPENPRALYFNDRVIVGYIPGAPMLEAASHDPRQGVIFQTLPQDVGLGTPPRFVRPDRCLTCHLSANSLGVPGILVRSMFTEATGRTQTATGQRHRRSPHAARATVGRLVRHRHTRRGEAHGQRDGERRARTRRRRDLRRARSIALALDARVDASAYPIAVERHHRVDGVRSPGPRDEPADAARMGSAHCRGRRRRRFFERRTRRARRTTPPTTCCSSTSRPCPHRCAASPGLRRCSAPAGRAIARAARCANWTSKRGCSSTAAAT